MRMRKKPWAEAEISRYPQWVVPDPHEKQGRWHSFFGNYHPIHVEIGIGKGRFICEMAKRNTHINYIGIEMQTSVAGIALRQLKEVHLENVCMLHERADRLPDFFSGGELERIYVNFSDPWPKRRHEKRRLTHPSYLKMYQSVLVEKGDIHLKTDNERFFEYSLNRFSDFGCRLRYITFDLQNIRQLENCPALAVDNVMTEYEQKFAEKGNRIYRCEAIMPLHAENERTT